jgi:hypothetical protein
MPLGIWSIEFPDHNSQRSYPLAAQATHRDITDTFELPKDFLIGLNLPVHAGLDVDPAQFFISKLGVYSNGFTLVVGYQPSGGGNSVDVANAMIARIGHTINLDYALGGLGNFADTIGRVRIGRLDSINEQPAGEFRFNLEDTRLETETIRPMIRGLSSLSVVNNNERSQRLYGDIVFRAGSNMSITPIVQSGQDPILQFNAIEGAGLTEDCVCGDTTSPPIRNINGVTPDADGRIDLFGGNCVEFELLAHGLRLKDSCSQPCCGCTELEVITSTLDQLRQQAVTLENFLPSLEASVTQMDLVVLGSRLGDRGCTS